MDKHKKNHFNGKTTAHAPTEWKVLIAQWQLFEWSEAIILSFSENSKYIHETQVTYYFMSKVNSSKSRINQAKIQGTSGNLGNYQMIGFSIDFD